MDTKDKSIARPEALVTLQPESCLFACTPEGVTVGIVTMSEPSPLALLAAGVAGMAARRARRDQLKS